MENMEMIETEKNKVSKKAGSRIKKAFTSVSGFATAVMATAMTAAAAAPPSTSAGGFGQPVTVDTTSTPDAGDLMGQIIGILLTITRFVGVALLIYGVYEIVMSFMQNQPEAKTKGIIMALAGVVMIALKSIIQGLGVIS